MCVALLASVSAFGAELWVSNAVVTCRRYEPGTRFDYRCWTPDGLADGEGAVYVFLEYSAERAVATLKPMMADGRIPPGLCVFTWPGKMFAADGGTDRWMRAEEYDQPGTEFPNALIEEIIPDAERRTGVRTSCSPDLHFIAGCSSGGIAAWNACWYRNDYFRRCYLNSPTFSNMRQGNQLMPLVRKCEARPIRAWISVGTFEPDYFFGDSYFVAADAVGALRFAGYEARFDRFAHEGHGTHWGRSEYTEKVLTWLFEDWRTKPIADPDGPIRVRNVVVKGHGWEPCAFEMPSPVREVRSTDGWRVYSVSPTNRFVMSERLASGGVRGQRVRRAPSALAWDVSQPGGGALALAGDDRLFVATELGVQGVVTFGIADVVLPLPGDLPCDNVALIGKTLYAASGDKVFRRTLRVGAADPEKRSKPSAPGYSDGFWYAREHEPAGGIGELLGSWVMSGRIRGAVSVVVGKDGREHVDAVGWSDEKRKRRLVVEDAAKYRPDDVPTGNFLHVFADPECGEAVGRLRRDWAYEAGKID